MMRFHYAPPSGLPEIVYQDEDIIVINKPSGLLSNPGIALPTHDCALSRLRVAFGDVILVHRLDCDTSGLMVFARTKQAESRLKKQWQARQVEKRYVALVFGRVDDNEGCIDLMLRPNKDCPPLQQICTSGGKAALTHYHVLERDTATTRLSLHPITGRTHQLRVHMLAIGHPILGDPFYGNPSAQSARKRLCLHADQLAFFHPTSQEKLTYGSAAEF